MKSAKIISRLSESHSFPVAIPSTAFNNLSTIDINNFEVIQTTGPNEGPRSPGAPTVNAGADQNVDVLSTTLAGSVVDPSGNAAIQWRLHSGPAPVNFANPNSANTMVVFGQSGSYTFLLSADDAVHAVAYDAVVVNVQTTSPTPTPTATPSPTPTPTVTPTPTPSTTPTPTPVPSTTPTIRVSVSPAQVAEGNDATFTVSSSVVLSRDLTVSYSMRGTAQQGSDYTLDGTLGQLTIFSGQSSATVVLHAVADHLQERNETATMILINGVGYKVPKRAKAILTIVNGP
jgi:hypothetical protein